MDEDPTLYGFLVSLYLFVPWTISPVSTSTTIFRAFLGCMSIHSYLLYMIWEVFGSILVNFSHKYLTTHVDWCAAKQTITVSLLLPPSSHQPDFAATSPWCLCPALSSRRPCFWFRNIYVPILYHLKFLFLFYVSIPVPCSYSLLGTTRLPRLCWGITVTLKPLPIQPSQWCSHPCPSNHHSDTPRPKDPAWNDDASFNLEFAVPDDESAASDAEEERPMLWRLGLPRRWSSTRRQPTRRRRPRPRPRRPHRLRCYSARPPGSASCCEAEEAQGLEFAVPGGVSEGKEADVVRRMFVCPGAHVSPLWNTFGLFWRFVLTSVM
jgi:hypothetical protein